MTFSKTFVEESVAVLTSIDTDVIERMAEGLAAVRERGGRLFILGVGGSAGHASHAVNDFRKICGFEAYTPTDNVSELTARANDEGWDTTFAEWLRGHGSPTATRCSSSRSAAATREQQRVDQPGRVRWSSPTRARSLDLRRRRPRRGRNGPGRRGLRGHPAALRRADHAAHRGSVRRGMAPARSRTRPWPVWRPDGSRCDEPRAIRRICVVGRRRIHRRPLRRPFARQRRDRRAHGLRQLLVWSRMASRRTSDRHPTERDQG